MSESKSGAPLRRVGWGRFPLPWTKRRRIRAEQRGQQLLLEAIARSERAATQHENEGLESTGEMPRPQSASPVSPAFTPAFEAGEYEIPGTRSWSPNDLRFSLIETSDWVARAKFLAGQSETSTPAIASYVDDLHIVLDAVRVADERARQYSTTASLLTIAEKLMSETDVTSLPASLLVEQTMQVAEEAIKYLDLPEPSPFTTRLTAIEAWQTWRASSPASPQPRWESE